MKFNKIYEDIFKAATDEDVIERQKQGELEESKEEIETNFHIKYEDLLKPENINMKDEYGYTPLIFASLYNYKEIVDQLLRNGADVNTKNNNGYTALIYASLKGYIEIVKLLLDKGADPNIKDNRGETALSWANKYKRKEIIDLLKQYGAKE